MADDQAGTIAFLASSAAHGGAAVSRLDTHASIVFLAANRAWKLKRAVRYDYLDFSTVERRRAMCLAEFALNQPVAPGIYRRVVPVTRERDGRLAIGGGGEPVDWLIEMTRFEQDDLFDRLAARGALDVSLMPGLAEAIRRAHDAAERRRDYGGHAGLSWVIDGHAAACRNEPILSRDGVLCRRVVDAARAANDTLRAVLDARRDAGHVRRCHGDLHLGNIVLFDGRPTLFDAVEFNDRISCIDVMYDLAFLLMDLWRLSLTRHANVLVNAYVAGALDAGTLAVLPLFLSCRAAVRAKTLATAARLQDDDTRRADLAARSHEYLGLADALLNPPAPCLVAVGGLSGSGKSALALALAPEVGPPPGAVVFRSDEVRKRLLGASPLERLGPEGYSRAVSDDVYAVLADGASCVVRERHAAVVDATFLRAADRRAIERVADAAGVRFVGLWLEAPDDVRLDRVRARSGDPSDADARVLRQQRVEAPETIGWRRIDASRPLADIQNALGTVIA